jgi:anti-anti-sigma regulatory factor
MESARLAYRIQRSVSSDAVVFAVSGEMNNEHAAQLQELVATEAHGPIRLDLKDITLVDRDAVRFLAQAESARIQIVNCPGYVRSWINGEGDNRGTEP